MVEFGAGTSSEVQSVKGVDGGEFTLVRSLSFLGVAVFRTPSVYNFSGPGCDATAVA